MKVTQQHTHPLSNLIICLLCNSLVVFVFNPSSHLLWNALFFFHGFSYSFVDGGQEPEHLVRNAGWLSQLGHTRDVFTQVYTK